MLGVFLFVIILQCKHLVMEKYISFFILLMLLLTAACLLKSSQPNLSKIPYNPTPHQSDMPKGFPKMEFPEDNPSTVEGVALGRSLFFDPVLSVDSSIACSFCHLPQFSFTDRHALSRGVKGSVVKRSSQSLLNVGLLRNGLYFWLTSGVNAKPIAINWFIAVLL